MTAATLTLIVLFVNAALLAGVLALFGGMEKTTRATLNGCRNIYGALREFRNTTSAQMIALRKETFQIMGEIENLQASFNNLSDAVSAEADQIHAALTEQSNQIQSLKDQIAAGSPASVEQLETLRIQADELASRVKNIVPDAPAPAE
jgi:chromosome segregation ATPase